MVQLELLAGKDKAVTIFLQEKNKTVNQPFFLGTFASFIATTETRRILKPRAQPTEPMGSAEAPGARVPGLPRGAGHGGHGTSL